MEHIPECEIDGRMLRIQLQGYVLRSICRAGKKAAKKAGKKKDHADVGEQGRADPTKSLGPPPS